MKITPHTPQICTGSSYLTWDKGEKAAVRNQAYLSNHAHFLVGKEHLPRAIISLLPSCNAKAIM